MLRRFIKSGAAPLKVAGLLAIGTAVHAAIPYLPLVGPSSLRFEVIKNSTSGVTQPVAAMKTNAPPIAVHSAVSETNGQLALATSTVSASGVSNLLSSGLASPIVSQSGDFNSTLAEGFSPAIFALPTPDLLGITPQTLAGYFHPVHFDTNAPVVGPFPLTFVPPVPSDKSSHAEYIIK